MPCTSKLDIFRGIPFAIVPKSFHIMFEYAVFTLLCCFGGNTWHLPHPLIRRAYTVPVQVGSSQQNLSLQVDTGSSDLVRHVFFRALSLPEPSFPVDRIQVMLISLMFSNRWTSV